MVTLDCHGSGGNPNWSHTNDTITVEARVNRSNNKMGSMTVPKSRCDQDDELVFTFPSFTADDVVQLIISTNGSDAFWIDRVRLYDAGYGSTGQNGTITLPKLRMYWDKNDNFGYCLSTDSKDCRNSYAIYGRAYAKMYFNTGF